MTFLIAEISNHHLGSVDKAKELILAAKNSGADAVKSQAFVAADMLKWGTMPLSFYEKCAMSLDEYRELIAFGRDNGIPVFFTVLSPGLLALSSFQQYQKLHAGGWKAASLATIYRMDRENTFISMNAPREDVPEIHAAKILYATPYQKDVCVAEYEALQKFYDGKAIGVSHHGEECGFLLLMHQIYYLPYVEKHFYMGKQISEGSMVYRDCNHSYDPVRFEKLAKDLK